MAIATGRVVGRVVDGQPSFTGNYGDKKSRPDHVLLPPALYKLVCSFKMRGEQSGWTPDPDEFENPDLSVLKGAVCHQFQKLSTGASSGFDAIPIPFIKHACLPERCDDKFKQLNVPVPLMARLFRVFLSESKVPACWKVAKLSPIHKKGKC